jgi:ABC-type multidrug transport system fused ATPase/permease subunit
VKKIIDPFNQKNIKFILLKIKNILIIIKDKFLTNKKYKIALISIIIFILLLITIDVINSKKNNISYNEIETIVKNKESTIIYYYNSRSINKYNRKVRKHLDKNNISYYKYNGSTVNKEEYNKFIKLLNIDKKTFKSPAIIYIKDGKVYGNLISIDNIEGVTIFMNDYDLYSIK